MDLGGADDAAAVDGDALTGERVASYVKKKLKIRPSARNKGVQLGYNPRNQSWG